MYKIIFFGNGPLADTTKSILETSSKILFHAKKKEDLETVKKIKQEHPAAFGVLASFGVLIKQDLLDLFEPEGILNIHPSSLPLYRGPSPIESAILNGDTTFSVSVMKLVKQMDAGPVYYQETFNNLPLDKSEIYHALATAGASWLNNNLDTFNKLRTSLASLKTAPTTNDDSFITAATSLFPGFLLQDDAQATFTKKLDKSLSRLTPDQDTADQTLRKIVAYQSFPKPRYDFFGQTCIILSAHLSASPGTPNKTLAIKCADDNYVIVDKLQPLSRNPMPVQAFLNGIKSS